jgi:hypothetical protein
MSRKAVAIVEQNQHPFTVGICQHARENGIDMDEASKYLGVRGMAALRGDQTYVGRPCKQCGRNTRHVADCECVTCRRLSMHGGAIWFHNHEFHISFQKKKIGSFKNNAQAIAALDALIMADKLLSSADRCSKGSGGEVVEHVAAKKEAS